MSISTLLLGNGEKIEKYFNSLGQLHCTQGPAFISSTQKEWYQDGLKHNDKGYAVFVNECNYIRVEWWIKGKRHRVGKPAVIDSNGVCEYWEEGELIKKV
jgi:hypothetical protein